MTNKCIVVIFIFTLSACSTFKTYRRLAEDEISRHQLSGILHEAKICPTVFDEATGASKINGSCEVVSCEDINGKITCWAKPE